MPVKRKTDVKGPFYQWGGKGAKYRYVAGDTVSRNRAKNKAKLQERAAIANGYNGNGLFSEIGRRLPTLREGAPPAVRSWVQKKGNSPIVNIQVWRAPLTSKFKTILNWITLGEFSKRIKTLNYDDVFHLYMVLYFSDGSRLRVDKNHVVEITDKIAGRGLAGERMNAGDPKCDLATFFNRGEKVAGGPRQMWVYSANSPAWNCQKFVSWCLKGSGLLSPQLDKFVNQDADGLVQGYLPRKFLGAVTGLAGREDRVINGQGTRKKK